MKHLFDLAGCFCPLLLGCLEAIISLSFRNVEALGDSGLHGQLQKQASKLELFPRAERYSNYARFQPRQVYLQTRLQYVVIIDNHNGLLSVIRS